jgi:hypothetical protein
LITVALDVALPPSLAHDLEVPGVHAKSLAHSEGRPFHRTMEP